ncbi:MAG: NlpC/P60 family protein [Gaiellales bacterium]
MRTFNASTATFASPHRSFLRPFLMLATGLLVAMGLLLPTGAGAVSLADKRAQAAELDRDVAKLEGRYGDLQERWRGALVELKEIQADAEDARIELGAARKDLRGAKGRLQNRAIAIYRDGAGSSELLQLVEAGSLRELFDRMDTMQRVGNQDVDILGRIRTAAKRVEAQEQRLRSARDRQTLVVKKAATSKKKMGTVLTAKRDRLNSVTAEIRSIMETQRAAAAREEARMARSRVTRVENGEMLDDAIDTNATAAPVGQPTAGADAATSAPAPAPSSVPLPPASGSAAAAASIAMGKVGVPYSYGAAGPNSFDCSGLVVWAFAQAGRPGLPHSTYSLIGMGVEVPLSQAQVGDLIFTNSAGHMGIYVGGGSFVHAPRTGRNVTVEGLGNYTVVSVRRV